MTAPLPCPYLPGRIERKVFAELAGPDAAMLNDALSRIGFRRSQGVAYRPSCGDCTACVSVRVVADAFSPTRSQKRIQRRNHDLVAQTCRAWATAEQYELLQRYLAARHPFGGMAGMEESDFADMVELTPIETHVIEYRLPRADGGRGRLIGACLTDRQSDGLSMIYSFFEPDLPDRVGLGTYIILDHIARARALRLPYVYLGYWVSGAERMAYKTRFRPLEKMGPQGWEPMGTHPKPADPAGSLSDRPGGGATPSSVAFASRPET